MTALSATDALTPSAPNLTDVPETMLWTLHNRSNEAMRDDGIIKDPKCIEIYRALDYDYEKSFGKADCSHAARSFIFDKAIDAFITKHPNAAIVNLGEGLETQRYRFSHKENAKNTVWFTVDVEDAIAIRERFIEADARHKHIACSALDTAWFDHIPKDRPVFISAQGLFMYFTESQVKDLIQAMFDAFPEGELMFDVIPRWLSNKTCQNDGWKKTPHYTTPKMPWGIDRNEAKTFFSRYSKYITQITDVPFLFPRGVWHWLVPIFRALPWLKNKGPSIFNVGFRS